MTDDTKGLFDKRSVFVVLGCLMKNPSLTEEYSLDNEDFEVEPFYEIIFSCICNLYRQGVNVIDVIAIDSMLSQYDKQYEIFKENDGLKYCSDAIDMAEDANFIYYYERIKKFSYLRFLEKQGLNTGFLYDTTITDPSTQEEEIQKFDSMTLEDMINTVDTFLVVESKIKFGSSAINKGQLAGKGMDELKEKLKGEPEFGLPLQSEFLTTIVRGARLKKLYVRSANSGGGKSRTSMADVCGFSIPWKYDIKVNKWVHTGFEEPSVFISTELDYDELQTLIMAYVSGVSEDKILDGNYIGNEEERVNQAIECINSSPLYIEVIPDFSIQDIENLIKKYKREKGCRYFVFDYVHTSAKLIGEISGMAHGMKGMREDQILFLFIDKLKNLCNTLDIFMLTMTQLNGTYKDSPIKDETLLRGSKAIADRIDLGEITLPPTKTELDGIKDVLSKRINCPQPNLVHHIYKVRRGKLTRIRIWQHADLGNCRTEDLFVTNNDNVLISVDATKVEHIQKAIDENSIDKDEIKDEPEKDEETKSFFGMW